MLHEVTSGLIHWVLHFRTLFIVWSPGGIRYDVQVGCLVEKLEKEKSSRRNEIFSNQGAKFVHSRDGESRVRKKK